MGFLQNQNLTAGSSQPEVAQWESTAHLSPAVNNTIIVLGVLTFALQLCLALFFMLRCWRLDRRVRETLKNPDKLTAPSSFHQDIYKQSSYRLCYDADATASSSAVSAAENYEPITSPVFGPSIPWDLVQGP